MDGVCRALLALQLDIRDLRRLLLACPALLACKPAALSAQAGAQPVPNLGLRVRACMPCVPVPFVLLSCVPAEVVVRFSVALLKVIVRACCSLQRACHTDKAVACGYILIQSMALLEQADCLHMLAA